MSTETPATPPPPAEQPLAQADETREIKTYEDALTYINSAVQNGADSKLLAPLQVFFKNRIERAPKPAPEHDEEAVKKAQLSRRKWTPYKARERVEVTAPELKI